MESKLKPIPAFYCCYLLRSTVRHASLYVGSSPHPSRRLAQHNGKVKGGAVRTSRLSLRPWEMACVVAGFPSNIAALQFEWAWQNPHLTRHVLPDDRISFPVTLIRTNRKTGKTRKKPGRPRTSLVERLSNLHLLLRTTYFSQWPLELRFFSNDVYRAWQSWCERVDTQLRSNIKVMLDPAQTLPETETDFPSAQRPAKRRKVDLIGKGGVEGVDPTYARFQEVFDKAQFLLDKDDVHECAVCKGQLDVDLDLFSICTTNGCTSVSHITCLSDKFLQDQGLSTDVPTCGCCPGCGVEVNWSELMRAVSLRIRGEKEVKKLLSKKHKTKAATAVDLMDDDVDEEDSATDTESLPPSAVADDYVSDSDEEDRVSVSSIVSLGATSTSSKPSPARDKLRSKIEIVIEDSEDERGSCT